MRLHVNLIPALAYALVTMFSNMAGLTGEVEQPSQKQQVVSLPDTSQEFTQPNGSVLVAENGQIILSNGYGNADLVWTIPDMQETNLATATAGKSGMATYVLRLAVAGKPSCEIGL